MTLRNRTLVDTLIERALGADTPAGEAPEPEQATPPTETPQEPD
jgi:hypothetical protein